MINHVPSKWSCLNGHNMITQTKTIKIRLIFLLIRLKTATSRPIYRRPSTSRRLLRCRFCTTSQHQNTPTGKLFIARFSSVYHIYTGQPRPTKTSIRAKRHPHHDLLPNSGTFAKSLPIFRLQIRKFTSYRICRRTNHIAAHAHRANTRAMPIYCRYRNNVSGTN